MRGHSGDGIDDATTRLRGSVIRCTDVLWKWDVVKVETIGSRAQLKDNANIGKENGPEMRELPGCRRVLWRKAYLLV